MKLRLGLITDVYRLPMLPLLALSIDYHRNTFYMGQLVFIQFRVLLFIFSSLTKDSMLYFDIEFSLQYLMFLLTSTRL